MEKHKIFLKTTKPIRAFQKPSVEMCIAFLWKDDQNVDSEGSEDGDEKSYKYLQNREKPEEKFEVDRIQKGKGQYVYEVSSDLESLAAKVAYCLAMTMEGEVGGEAQGPFSQPSILLEKIEKSFDLDAAFQRLEKSRNWR